VVAGLQHGMCESAFNLPEPCGPHRPVKGLLYLFINTITGWARTHTWITVPIYKTHFERAALMCKTEKSDLRRVIFPAKATLCFGGAHFHAHGAIC
jgi:hypothetical protein